MTLRAALLAVAVGLAAAPAASAATLTADSDCYQETEEAVVRGTGFAPREVVTLSRDGRAIGRTRTTASGTFRVKFPTQRLAGGRQRRVDVAATDGTVAAVTRYHVARIYAGFAPGAGNPATLRVRFRVSGFNVMRPRSTVYLHYIRPDGRRRLTLRLGRARGVCGVITRTRQRLLFGFRAERGRWILQFDTNRRYRRGLAKSSFIWVRKPVEVFGRG